MEFAIAGLGERREYRADSKASLSGLMFADAMIQRDDILMGSGRER